MPIKKADFFKIKDRTQVYHVPSDLRISHPFDTLQDARAFVEQIPESCCIIDLPDNAEQKAILLHTYKTFKKPDRILFETGAYVSPIGRQMFEQRYTGILEPINDRYAIVKLNHATASSYDREAGYDGLWLCLYDLWPVGIGSSADMKAQIKLWMKIGYSMTAPGVFQSACRRYRTASERQVTVLTGAGTK